MVDKPISVSFQICYRSGSSSWHESCCLQPPAVYLLLCLGHRPAFCGQRSHTAQVFSSTGVLRHSARHRSSNPAPLYRGLHCSYPVEESQAKESGLTSGRQSEISCDSGPSVVALQTKAYLLL